MSLKRENGHDFRAVVIRLGCCVMSNEARTLAGISEGDTQNQIVQSSKPHSRWHGNLG